MLDARVHFAIGALCWGALLRWAVDAGVHLAVGGALCACGGCSIGIIRDYNDQARFLKVHA